ncbi:hypothetical protein [Gottfriedia solisilvae]|uniref:hypothetical protein n=1 Tax=Gottfriedia solisilvae TaxID=1516104 RepID=UPI003D2F4E07
MAKRERKVVTWRIQDHPKYKLLNNWCNSQDNIQDSITNIVLHLIERFGNKDITDFDIQRILHSESLGIETVTNQPIQPVKTTKKQVKPEEKDIVNTEVEEVEMPTHNSIKDTVEKPEEFTEINDKKAEEIEEEDDFYSQIDPTKI